MGLDALILTFGAGSVVLLVHAGLLATRRPLPGVLARGSVLGSACTGIGMGFLPLAYALDAESGFLWWALPVLTAAFAAAGVRFSNREARNYVAS